MSEPNVSITEITRRAIFDEIRGAEVSWWGKLKEAEFLSRVFDLTELPSHDGRCQSMFQDVDLHRDHFCDWDDDWVMTDERLGLMHQPDEVFLQLLCEMVHPIVRPDAEESRGLVSSFNRHLELDGWELVESRIISGRPTYVGRRRLGEAVELRHESDVILSDEYVRELSGKCSSRLASGDLEGAITTARTMLEAVLQELDRVLDDQEADFGGDLPRLFKSVSSKLGMDTGRTDLDASFKQVVRGLVQVVHGLAPIRNRMSDGHPRQRKPAPHHASVIVNASRTVATFLVESYAFQRNSGRI